MTKKTDLKKMIDWLVSEGRNFKVQHNTLDGTRHDGTKFSRAFQAIFIDDIVMSYADSEALTFSGTSFSPERAYTHRSMLRQLKAVL